ncbi:MAG: signal recognition particle-docking protein FtsY [Chloroflexota bacterium]|nr:signal recognition particle-docking protein FtsY [Chloroflexota bacterium]
MLNWFRRRDEAGQQEAEASVGPDAHVALGGAEPPEIEQDRARVEDSLEKTRAGFFGKIRNLFGQGADIDEGFFDELEELLIQADVGVPTTEKLVRGLRDQVRAQGIAKAADARLAFQDELAAFLEHEASPLDLARPLTLILVVGVNGSGKTTSIGKLASYLIGRGHRVVLAAGDTFRAAAIEQLQAWGARAGVPIVTHQPGSDPGAVIYDAIESAEARQADVVLADTAGRLHTKFNLMEELRKISRVAGKRLPDAPHEVLLVLDATTGQNAIAQAKQFAETAGVTGVVLTKLDSTAKGGMVLAIRDELGLPVKFVGTGEKIGDLAPFDPDAFAEALLS